MREPDSIPWDEAEAAQMRAECDPDPSPPEPATADQAGQDGRGESDEDRDHPLVKLLKQKRKSIDAVASPRMETDRIIRLAALALTRNRDLANCDRTTVLESVVTAAQLGLDISGTGGRAHLIPYDSRCQLVIGYRGMIDLMHRHANVAKVEAWPVYEGDEFAVRYGTDPAIEHAPAFRAEARRDDQIVGAYAVATFRDGSKTFAALEKWEIDKIREASRAGRSGPWRDNFPRMACKTAIRRLFTYMPQDEALDIAMEIADRTEFEFDGFDPRRMRAGGGGSRVAALEDRFARTDTAAVGELSDRVSDDGGSGRPRDASGSDQSGSDKRHVGSGSKKTGVSVVESGRNGPG